MTSAIQVLSEEMEKLSYRIKEDLLNTLVNLSGSLKDIECGTHIKIPMGAGYVNYYKSVTEELISFWLKESLLKTENLLEQQEYLNIDDEH